MKFVCPILFARKDVLLYLISMSWVGDWADVSPVYVHLNRFI